MFDPSLGRWLTEDPVGYDAGDPNLYRFVGNDPTDLVDPSGLAPEAKSGIKIKVVQGQDTQGQHTYPTATANWSIDGMPALPANLTYVTLVDMKWKIGTCDKCDKKGETTAEGGYKMWFAGVDVYSKPKGGVNLGPKHGGQNEFNNGNNKVAGYPSFENQAQLDQYLANSFGVQGTQGTLSITVTVRGFSGLQLAGFNPKLKKEYAGPTESPGSMPNPGARPAGGVWPSVPTMPNRLRDWRPRQLADWTDQPPPFWGGKNDFEYSQSATLTWDYCGDKLNSETK
ncbi:RHS repeat-associated core domain-containing protein [Fimbriiglobus ruber]|uniref:RHS repeat-associated core domain-containing protein n=1 Tax=Fimbriiglobus ruber TaxID=1908690 RepID=A0A225CZJ2_9BACT|nr:RHS repeat-associated core domain-containing protein [Fimbriiglobus ruber]OWK34780.1 hypothetical protein FRUB_09622 [Fimbriiglobus ruber]